MSPAADRGADATNGESHELGPYRPVLELQVLAAVERARRHGDLVLHHAGALCCAINAQDSI
jgi:hypothetical protein